MLGRPTCHCQAKFSPRICILQIGELKREVLQSGSPAGQAGSGKWRWPHTHAQHTQKKVIYRHQIPQHSFIEGSVYPELHNPLFTLYFYSDVFTDLDFDDPVIHRELNFTATYLCRIVWYNSFNRDTGRDSFFCWILTFQKSMFSEFVKLELSLKLV